MTVEFKLLRESNFSSEFFILPTLANFSDFLAAITKWSPVPLNSVFLLRLDFEGHLPGQFLASRGSRGFSTLGVPVCMLDSWIIPLSGRKWTGKMRMKWKKKWDEVLYEKPGSIPTHLCLDSYQVDMSYDGMVCIRQPTPLLLCSGKCILTISWSSTLGLTLPHDCLTSTCPCTWYLYTCLCIRQISLKWSSGSYHLYDKIHASCHGGQGLPCFDVGSFFIQSKLLLLPTS